jgi:hypothetical protein
MANGQGFGGNMGYGQNFGNPGYGLTPQGGNNMGFGQSFGNPGYSLGGGQQQHHPRPPEMGEMAPALGQPPMTSRPYNGGNMGFQSPNNPGYSLNPDQPRTPAMGEMAPALGQPPMATRPDYLNYGPGTGFLGR